jgi:hypothetical protein
LDGSFVVAVIGVGDVTFVVLVVEDSTDALADLVPGVIDFLEVAVVLDLTEDGVLSLVEVAVVLGLIEDDALGLLKVVLVLELIENGVLSLVEDSVMLGLIEDNALCLVEIVVVLGLTADVLNLVVDEVAPPLEVGGNFEDDEGDDGFIFVFISMFGAIGDGSRNTMGVASFGDI